MIEIDGRRIGDSTAIIAALEEYRPEPPLYPADAAERARALALEDWFDENLGPEMRRFVWHHTLSDTDVVARTLFQEPGPKRERFLRATAPVARVAVRRDYTVNARPRRGRATGSCRPWTGSRRSSALRLSRGRGLHRGRPDRRVAVHAAGRAPGAALRAAARTAPGVQELRDELMARPGGEWVERMYALHRNGPRVEEPHAVGG